MKKIILISLAGILGFSVFSFVSKSLDRSKFELEITSLMAVAQGLNSRTAPGLFINKAKQSNITLLEEDIRFNIQKFDGTTKTSKLLEKRGLSAETYKATLELTYSQSFLGSSRTYSLSRTRTFTKSVSIPPALPASGSPLFEE